MISYIYFFFLRIVLDMFGLIDSDLFTCCYLSFCFSNLQEKMSFGNVDLSQRIVII